MSSFLDSHTDYDTQFQHTITGWKFPDFME